MTPSVLLLTASKNGLDRSRLQLHFTDGVKSEVAVEKNDDVSAQRENRFITKNTCQIIPNIATLKIANQSGTVLLF